MIGRAAIHNPFIFKQLIALYHQTAMPDILLLDRFNLMSNYIDQSINFIGEKKACRLLRSRLGWFSKGLPNSSLFRDAITQIETREQVQTVLWNFYHEIKAKFRL